MTLTAVHIYVPICRARDVRRGLILPLPRRAPCRTVLRARAHSYHATDASRSQGPNKATPATPAMRRAVVSSCRAATPATPQAMEQARIQSDDSPRLAPIWGPRPAHYSSGHPLSDFYQPSTAPHADLPCPLASTSPFAYPRYPPTLAAHSQGPAPSTLPD